MMLCSLHVIDLGFFKLQILIHIFHETTVFCENQGKQYNVSVSGQNEFTFKSRSRKERKYASAVPRQGRKSGFFLDWQIGCLTLLALSLAHWSAHASDLLHQGFLMIVALISSYSERMRFILLGSRHCQSQNCQMLVTSLD